MVVAASASGGREEIINYKGGDTGETVNQPRQDLSYRDYNNRS